MTIAHFALAVWIALPVLLAALASLRRRTRALDLDLDLDLDQRPVHTTGTLLLLRPVHGAPTCLDEAAYSSRHAGRASKVRFLVEVDDMEAQRAVAPAVLRLAAEGLDVAVVRTSGGGANPKVAQLAYAERIESLDDDATVMVADADVVLIEANLEELRRALVGKDDGIAWSPPIERDALTWADRASRTLLGASLHSFPLLAGIDEAGMVGKCFMLRARTLRALGGFGALSKVLGEDMELARRAREGGVVVRCTLSPVASAARGRTVRDVFNRYVRWLLVIRHQRPHLLVSYPALFSAFPLQVLASAFVAKGWVFATLACGGRWIVSRIARRTAGVPRAQIGDLFAIVLSDLLLVLAFFGALFIKTTRWGRTRLRFQAGGYLRAEDAG